MSLSATKTLWNLLNCLAQDHPFPDTVQVVQKKHQNKKRELEGSRANTEEKTPQNQEKLTIRL